MTLSRTRHSKKGSHAASGRHGAVRSSAGQPLDGHMRDRHVTSPALEVAAPASAEVDRLMGQMRDANERLVVAAIRAQSLSDEAHAEATQARAELDGIMSELEDANKRLGAAAAAQAMAEKALEREGEYRRLSNRLLTLQDDERRRLALDLHDTVAQDLAVLGMNLALFEQNAPALDAGSSQLLAECRSLADECCREVRVHAYLLHPPLLDETGLVSAVRLFADGFTSRSGIHVVLALSDIGRLPGPIEIALFRVVQESLTNVHRHASTGNASIRLATTSDEVSLEIRDQGRGLSDDRPPQHGRLAPRTPGVGIQGMRERITQLKGTFAIEFTGRGTVVRVRVPLNLAAT
jgi:signal transduction histidine kinase